MGYGRECMSTSEARANLNSVRTRNSQRHRSPAPASLRSSPPMHWAAPRATLYTSSAPAIFPVLRCCRYKELLLASFLVCGHCTKSLDELVSYE